MEIPELVIAGPDSVAASVPFIIGFTPRDSLVVMWMRDGQVRLTMRLDLPPAHAAPDEWVDAVMSHRSSSDEVIICVFASPDIPIRADRGELHAWALVTSLLDRLSGTECKVRDALLVSGEHWWSYLCDVPECCPPAGRPIDPAIAQEVAARFALAGVAPLADRQEVVAVCSADPDLRAITGPQVHEAGRAFVDRLARAQDPRLALEAWRDEAISAICSALTSGAVGDPAGRAEILLALSDVRVRDTVLWELAHSTRHDGHRAFERSAALLRAAPDGVVAPIGSVTAVLGWLIGDGVRAMAAVDRVTAEDPEHALAELLTRSVQAGLSPASWLEMMHDLGRDACRGRSSVPARAAGE